MVILIKIFANLLNTCDLNVFDNSEDIDVLWDIFLRNIKTKTILESWVK